MNSYFISSSSSGSSGVRSRHWKFLSESNLEATDFAKASRWSWICLPNSLVFSLARRTVICLQHRAYTAVARKKKLVRYKWEPWRLGDYHTPMVPLIKACKLSPETSIFLLGFFTITVALGISTKIPERNLKKSGKKILYQEDADKNLGDPVTHSRGKARNQTIKIILHTIAIQHRDNLLFLFFA